MRTIQASSRRIVIGKGTNINRGEREQAGVGLRRGYARRGGECDGILGRLQFALDHGDEYWRWEGEGGGGGLEVGYVMNISRNKRWRLEFSAGIGYFYTRFDPYIYGNPVTEQEDGNYYYDYTGNAKNFKERNHKSSFIDPTHLGVTLTYDLLYRRIQKKGVSVHRKEAMINE